MSVLLWVPALNEPNRRARAHERALFRRWTRLRHARNAKKREFGGLDDARALAIWHNHVLNKLAGIITLGFGEPFRRIWRDYQGYCEAGST